MKRKNSCDICGKEEVSAAKGNLWKIDLCEKHDDKVMDFIKLLKTEKTSEIQETDESLWFWMMIAFCVGGVIGAAIMFLSLSG